MKNRLTSQSANGPAALTSPDWTFITSDSAVLVESVSGNTSVPEFCPRREAGIDITADLPGEVARLIKMNIRKVLRSRAEISFQFDVESEARRYELRLIVAGRALVMGVLRDLQRFPAGNEAQSASNTAVLARISNSAELLLDAAVSEARLRERGLAVMVIGLDQFASLTKRLGKPVRRSLLKTAKQRIEDCLRRHGRHSCHGAEEANPNDLTRLDHEEFMVVLQDIDSRDALREVADRIRVAFVSPLEFEEHQLLIEPIVGIAMHPGDGDTGSDLLNHARVALDEATIRNDDGYEFYSSTMRFRAVKRIDEKSELGWAIDNNQLSLRYLPRIDLRTGRITGLEALLRWEHPLRGVVALDEVLPVAEASGLMRPLGEWILESACAQAERWRRDIKGMPPVSINLSESEFSRDGLAAIVLNTLESSGLPAAALELEIGEKSLTRASNAELILEKLRDIGIGLVIDDFGVGYSSLARLARLPIQAIKIDRSFIERCASDSPERAVCAATIAMAKSLGLTVIAEGVENLPQIDFLRREGCDALQGFLVSEPLTAAAVPDFIANNLAIVPDTSVIGIDTLRTRFRAFGAI
ncbi:MAG: EAL domain-containing protein [Woeseia sp.]